jgi:sn-glycerol 3-phosphate transport system substrate-binding protein
VAMPIGTVNRTNRTNRSTRTKLARVIAVGVLLALTAAACGGGSGNSGGDSNATAAAGLAECPVHALDNATSPVEVTLWHFLSSETGEALKSLVAQYNASQTKVKVVLESQGTSNDELFRKYQAGIKNNDLPGIAVMDDTVTQQVIDSKTVLPAQSCINADHVDMSAFLQSGRDYYTVDHVLWPASVNLSGALLYYNKGHFRQAGLDPETTPKTLDEMRQFAQKIKDAHVKNKDGKVVEKPIALKVNSPMIEMWLTGEGSPVVNNDNGRGTGTTDQAALDNDVTRNLYTWIKSMSDDGLLNVIPDTQGQVDQYLAMAQGTASMTIETSTAATTVEKFLGGKLDPNSVGVGSIGSVDPNALDIGAGAVPGITAPGQLGGGGGAWYITSTTPPEVQAGAWDFMKFFNSLDSQVLWNTKASYLPYLNAATKDPRVVTDWTTTLSGRWLALAYDELTTGIDPNFAGPLMGPYEQFRKSIRASIDGMVFNGKAPADVVKQASDETTAALQQYQRENF